MKFGDALSKRVDMSKVKLDVLRPWISQKITDILNIEDDVVVEFVYNQLEEEKFPCPKKMQINMTGFLNGKNARVFMDELWALLLSAQESETGIPAEFIQMKKDEILKREEESSKISDLRNNRSKSKSRSKSRDHIPTPARNPELQARVARLEKRTASLDKKEKTDVNDTNNKENNVEKVLEKSTNAEVDAPKEKDRGRDRSKDRKKSPEKSKVRAKSREKSRDREKDKHRERDRRSRDRSR